MSGIAGLIRFDGGPVDPGLLPRVTRAMAYRGPDGIHHWTRGSVALGHCLLRTTEEAEDENQPLTNEDESLGLVMDGWLENWVELRQELLAKGVPLRTRADSELVLRAYETWGRACVAHLHGDFAIVIWDARRQELFCARDRIGMRPFHYSYSQSSGFCFASDPQALLTLPSIPRRLNEGRIADAIVEDLEGLDLTSTFYLDIHRLPPAHVLIVSSRGLHTERYWSFEPPPLLRLGSDEAYAEAFLDVLTEAVRCRLRGGTTTAAMLSGGLDSSSVVAIARRHLAKSGQPALRTFSAVGPGPETCLETQTIHAAAGMGGIEPHFVDYTGLGELMPELADLSLAPLTPFDTHMTLVRAVYLAAHRAGAKAVLDGVGGDLVLGDGGYLPFLLRQGRWTTAVREAHARRIFWGGGESAPVALLRAARSAAVPNWARRLRRQFIPSRHGRRRVLSYNLIHPEFARRIGLNERIAVEADNNRPRAYEPAAPAQRAAGVFHFHNTAARERYEREAARLGIEPRDPFLDLRTITFCLSLPVEQTVRDGWPKFIMRSAMSGKLPDAVRWRRGKTHLGWQFTTAVMGAVRDQLVRTAREDMTAVAPYLDVAALNKILPAYANGSPLRGAQEEQVYSAILLARWFAAQSSA